MTENEAIEIINGIWEVSGNLPEDGDDVEIALMMAKDALEEIQQYRALGTVEELREAMEKQKWIPCSERLPEECEDVLVWYEYFRYGEYNSMFQTFGIGYHEGGIWHGDVCGQKARCIAWKPLPEPYKPA